MSRLVSRTEGQYTNIFIDTNIWRIEASAAGGPDAGGELPL